MMEQMKLSTSFTAAGAVLLLLLLLAPLVSTARCSWDWLLYKDSCYGYHNQSQYWYDGEMACKETGGHLVSIADEFENRLVSKLSLCNSTWIGLYAKDLTRMTEPGGYAWTDEKATSHDFSRHNFSSQELLHRPLIRSQNLIWYNALYHEQHPFVCESPAQSAESAESATECPSRMKFFQGNCYLLPSFDANFIEANFFCQNHSTNLASVLTEAELRFLNTLDLTTDSCQMQPVWLGLVKLNPCNPDAGGRELCYQWTDFSGKHLGFPRWADEHPPPVSDAEDSCVALTGDFLVGAACNQRKSFVCKVKAGALSGDAWKALDAQPVRDQPPPSASPQVESAVNSSASSAEEAPQPTPATAPETQEATVKVPTETPPQKDVEVTPKPHTGEATMEEQEPLERKDSDSSMESLAAPTDRPPADSGFMPDGPPMRRETLQLAEPTISSPSNAEGTTPPPSAPAKTEAASPKDAEDRNPDWNMDDIGKRFSQWGY